MLAADFEARFPSICRNQRVAWVVRNGTPVAPKSGDPPSREFLSILVNY